MRKRLRLIMALLSSPPRREKVAAFTESAHIIMARKHDAYVDASNVVALASCIVEEIFERLVVVVVVVVLVYGFLCE